MAPSIPPRRQMVPLLYLWVILLLVLIAIGAVGVYQTLWYGLEVTNLTDRVPWGLWITHDLSAIALGAGAFTFSAVVYLFRLKRFEPLARAAVFVGFLGYTSAMLALAMDIGRPDRFWHPLVYWNVHSVLWEITWCVVLYSTVLIIEFLPILFESRFFIRWPRLRQLGHTLHKLTPVMAAIGMGLSLLHQSSLGATYGVLSSRSIWFKPSLPVMFILSAIAGGVSLTLLVTLVTERLKRQELISRSLYRDVARFIAFVLLAYLYLKLWDWAATSYYSHPSGTADVLQRLELTTPFNQSFWLLEVLLGIVVPVFILLSKNLKARDRYVWVALVLVIIGVVVNRWNVTLSGLVAPPQWSPGVLGNVVAAAYLPSWVEIAVSLGVLGYGLLGFTLGFKYLPIYLTPHNNPTD
ncbi:MAG: polysulfide reductase NrfD [Chloroflexi bacterium]|nr:polysulfide reductase NrfD [Chloroflexota bacterium]MBP8054656.1 polysulfide reductase NrfD [Chloroflexota bacterium]